MIRKIESITECKSRRDVASLLEVELSFLNCLAYSDRVQYKIFTIPKKSGGLRQIMAPPGPLLNVQKKLADEFDKVYPNHISAKGFVKGQSIIKNASLHVGKRSVLNFDIENFFPSINSRRVFGLLKAAPFRFNNEVASVITKLVTYRGVLPQGAPTSPVLSNMVCFRMDAAFLRLSKKYRCVYTRYADDITISSRQNLPMSVAVYDESNTELGAALIKILSHNGFSANVKKTRLQSGNMAKYVTGIKVNKIPNVQRSYIKDLKAILHSWTQEGLTVAQQRFDDNYKANGRKIEDVVRGRINFIKDVKGRSDLVYRRLYNKLVELEERDLGIYRESLPLDKIQDLNRRVFIVKCGLSTGSGFILQNEGLMTCNHVVSGTGGLSFFDNRSVFDIAKHEDLSYREAVSSSDDKFDLAILKAPVEYLDNSDLYFKLSERDVAVGDRYVAIGYPMYLSGDGPRTTPVTVTVMKSDSNGVTMAYVENALIQGNSGGPVVDENNEVVGIVQRGGRNYNESTSSIGFAFLPVQEIKRFMKESKEKSISEILDIISLKS